MNKAKPNDLFEDLADKALLFARSFLSEIFNGIRYERIDVVRFLYPGLIVATLLVLRADIGLAWFTGIKEFEIPMAIRERVVYLCLFLGWVIWGVRRANFRMGMLSRLKTAFVDCGFKVDNKLPAFISDSALDDHVRCLKLYNQGVPLKSFLDNKEKLQTHLNISIIKFFEEKGDKSRINILYAMEDLATSIELDSYSGFEDGEIPIGVSFEGPVTAKLRDVAHILVAGQTGGGKSNFEKVAASVLTTSNPDSKVVFLDFKAGMEIADLLKHLGAHHSNFSYHEGVQKCVDYLEGVGAQIENQLTEIARVGASDLDSYLVMRESHPLPQKNDSESGSVKNKDETPRRTYIIIDEIAQLYARNGSVQKKKIEEARAAVNRIARQGRAAGIHLIIATQKPDSMSFDQTVKANLPAVLCFPMSTQAASISALGTKRAFDLNPEIKGRAVWKYGPKTTEIQTYRFGN